MAKVTHGEYSAFNTPGGIRFQKNKKMVSINAVPPEVAALLKSKLPAKFELSATEKAKLREESLKVPDELARTDEEMAAARPLTPVVEPEVPVDPLTEDDFDIPQEPVTDEEIEAVASQGDMPGVNKELPTPEVDPNFLEQVSIHSASIFDIAEALYNRFGLYTVYLNRLPVLDEVNPLSGETFSKYHHGIAYQAAIRAKAQGTLQLPADSGKKAMEAGRSAHENFAVDKQPANMGEARRQDSFQYRTSPQATQPAPTTEIVHQKGADGRVRAVQVEIPPGAIGEHNGAKQRYDKEEDEQLVEPAFGRQVIRPDWADK